MSNLSRLRHRSARSARQAASSMRRYNNGSRYSKQPKKIPTLLEYAIRDNDLMVMIDTFDLFPEFTNSIIKLEPFGDHSFRCEKVCLIYSRRKKLFMYLAMNDNYTGAVIYKEQNVYKLPYIYKIEAELKQDYQQKTHINENSNRLLNTLLDTIPDLTSNPVHLYKVNELFSK